MTKAGTTLRAFVVWAHLAAFGIAIAVAALRRALDRDGAGSSWKRARTNGAEVDALVRATELYVSDAAD